MSTKLVGTKEASKIIGLSESALRQGRMNGVRKKCCPTPPYVKLGRAIRYSIEDLDKFIEEHRIVPPNFLSRTSRPKF
jgi:hypothetical protein